jgi:hypothetical protein
MPKLWREVSWISAAAAALLIALFSSQNGASEQRPAASAAPITVVAKSASAPAPHAVESDATRQVGRTVRELTEDLSRITTRLAAVERSIDDLTNTVMQQNQPGKEASSQPLPAWTKDETVTSTVAPASGAAPAADARSPSSEPEPAADAQADSNATGAAAAYGAEIGGAPSMKALIARWSEVRSAHPEIFENLKPVAAVKDNPRTNRVELRLVISSFANRAGAVKLCASLATLRIACQPVLLDGQQLALQ